MNILAVDTSGTSCGAAVRMNGRTTAERTRQERRQHSAEILPMIDEVLMESGLSCGEIDLFACVVGPGSFTGVRIGVSTVRALAHATGKPCMGINALEALAAGQKGQEGILCPMIDARSGQVYAAAFASGFPPARHLPDTAGPVGDFLRDVSQFSGHLYFLGDGAQAYASEIQASLGGHSFFPQDAATIRPGAVAELAEEMGLARAVSYDALLPHYIRAPQAERERLARKEAEAAGE